MWRTVSALIKRNGAYGLGILAVLAMVCPAAMGDPVPVLEFPFTDVTGTTVPNHGSLGATGDASLGGTAAVAGATPIIRAGYANSALVVDSGSDKMATANIASLDALGSFTLSFFVKAPNSGNWAEMMGDTTSTTGPPTVYNGWYLQAMGLNAADPATRNRVFFLVGAGTSASTQFYSAPDFLLPGTWQHLALVVTGLQTPGPHNITVDFYRNGALFQSQSLSGVIMGATPGAGFTIGNTHWDGSLLAQYAGVAMFDTALTAEQVNSYYGFLITTPEPGALVSLVAGMGCLSAWWLARRRRSRG